MYIYIYIYINIVSKFVHLVIIPRSQTESPNLYLLSGGPTHFLALQPWTFLAKSHPPCHDDSYSCDGLEPPTSHHAYQN